MGFEDGREAVPTELVPAPLHGDGEVWIRLDRDVDHLTIRPDNLPCDDVLKKRLDDHDSPSLRNGSLTSAGSPYWAERYDMPP